MKNIRPIAIYLPQFHPIPENDQVWGKGFTEWTNVAKAQPRFQNHYQPRHPADLGYYDLRLDQVRTEQAEMAKKHNIEGFCYYHYWFNGKRLLNQPLDDVISSKKPDFPFMLCWANENWTKRWDGKDEEVIIKQDYSHQDDLDHITHLIPIFKDSRYIKIDGKPVFVIYKSHLFPDMKKTIDIWRAEALKNGLEIYICRMEHYGFIGDKYLKPGFDAAVQFMPYLKTSRFKDSIIWRANKMLKFFYGVDKLPYIYSYKKYVEQRCNDKFPEYKRFPCVTPMWDNSSRRDNKSFFALHNSTPKLFKKWIEAYLKKFTPYSKSENLFFINAWNEWAEGNYLEPDKKWGYAYLEAVKEAFSKIKKQN